MSESFNELTLPQVITILVVVALFTVSLAFFGKGCGEGSGHGLLPGRCVP
jgi:hypothetical protein